MRPRGAHRGARARGGAGTAEALSNFGFQYLTQTYLPQKLARGDWI